MKDYILGLVIVTTVASVICFMAPSENLKKPQRLVAALCIICVSIEPMLAVVDFVREFDISLYIPEVSSETYEDMWEGYLEDYGEAAVKDFVFGELRERFGVEAERVNVSYAEDLSRIERIYIGLPRSAAFKDTAKIEIYFENIFECEVISAIE